MTIRIANKTLTVSLAIAMAVLARAGWKCAGHGMVYTGTGADVRVQCAQETLRRVAIEQAIGMVKAQREHAAGRC